MIILVLFDNNEYSRYSTTEEFIKKCYEKMWNEGDIFEIIVHPAEKTYSFKNFIYQETLKRIEESFLPSIGGSFSDKTTKDTVEGLLKKMLFANQSEAYSLRDALLYILEDEMMYCQREVNDKIIQELDIVGEYLQCLCF